MTCPRDVFVAPTVTTTGVVHASVPPVVIFWMLTVFDTDSLQATTTSPFDKGAGYGAIPAPRSIPPEPHN